MQVTTLNKIINLFLVGTFAIIFGILITIAVCKGGLNNNDTEQIKNMVDSFGPPLVAVVATFLLFSSGIMVGIAVDAISNLISNYIIRKYIIEDSVVFGRIRKLFFCEEMWAQHEMYSDRFAYLFQRSPKYQFLTKNKEFTAIRGFATAIFFHTANKENIEWAIQHYSFYMLAMNYLLIIIIETVFSILFPISWLTWALTTVVNLGLIYTLLYQALHKYLYTYEVTFRHCSVVLSEQRKK